MAKQQIPDQIEKKIAIQTLTLTSYLMLSPLKVASLTIVPQMDTSIKKHNKY